MQSVNIRLIHQHCVLQKRCNHYKSFLRFRYLVDQFIFGRKYKSLSWEPFFEVWEKGDCWQPNLANMVAAEAV